MRKKLFIPGPVDVAPDVLEKLATPMISHRSKEASELQKRISDNLRILMYTKNEILLSTSSGSGLMEAAIRSCTRKKAAVFSMGAFGERWYKMATSNNINADMFKVNWGEAITPEMVDKALATGEYDLITVTHNETSSGVMNPLNEIAEVVKKYPEVIFCLDTVSSLGGAKIEVDKWGVDICIASTQKCLGLPPGLALCSVSDKAIEAAKEVEFKGFYFDLVNIKKYVDTKPYQYPSTPSLPHMFALDYQLDKILNKEGLENRFSRHEKNAKYVRDWAKKYFDLYSDEQHLSNTVTNVKNTKGISVKDLNNTLGERGFVISNGYGELKEKTFRIAHMAETTKENLQELFNEIEDILSL
ncbi:MAG: alanine--glyoxylate aminotransferase family protein [Bacillota bacterium]|nr:alanine--glyoxylate aminotransferase family protein [Bacillota bacterium]